MYRVLIVEDEPAIAETMKKQIECWGNEAACVTDFQNVVAEFASYDPHLVLMDIMLPFYNGYHWCTEIRKISDVPVIFVSSCIFIGFYIPFTVSITHSCFLLSLS